MSSETSIESHDPVRLKADPTGERFPPTGGGVEASDPLQPWQLFTLAGLIGATIVVFVSRGHTPAGIILLSLTIFAAAAIGIAAWRTFGPFAMRDESESVQILGGRTRSALEREKALALRSIKELEFDRAMGKVSEKDFAEMGGRLRARATRLMRQLDLATGYRGEIQKEIERRMTLPPLPERVSAPKNSQSVGGPATTGVPAVTCASCRTSNEPDARFCKNCGTSLERRS